MKLQGAEEQQSAPHHRHTSGPAISTNIGEGRAKIFLQSTNSGGRVTDTTRLMERMQKRTKECSQVEVRLGEREEQIKTHYANSSSTEAVFNKDERLAELITETKANFFKLDRILSEDHAIATQRLHSTVFTLAADFLQLFRDVNTASTLVESLKSRVMATKAAISSISKFTTHGGNDCVLGATTAGAAFGASLQRDNVTNTGHSDNISGTSYAAKARARPSLVVMRFVRRGNTLADISAIDTCGQNMKDSFKCDNSTCGGDVIPAGGIYLSATTRSLNTPSVRLWREATLKGGGMSLSLHRYRHLPSGLMEKGQGMSSAQKIVLFADVMREEVMRVVAGRRYVEAAELLRGMEDEAVAKGCLPLLLSLEAELVNAIETHLHRMPMPFMYSESVHIPLIQLLLRFGSVLSGTRLFFQLHTTWVDAEIKKLQQRLGLIHSALIVSDFLVEAMQEVLQRQQYLWHTLSTSEEGNTKYDSHDIGNSEERKENLNNSEQTLSCGLITNTTATTNSNVNNKGGTTAAGGGILSGCSSSSTAKETCNTGSYHNIGGKTDTIGTNKKGHSIRSTLPSSSTAVLWVRARVDKLAREVLESSVLSYGLGAEGGDPSRFRRAMAMAAEAICTLRRMDDSGYACCDAHLSRLLTPSLIYLHTDFSACTSVQLHSTGKTLMENLIHDVRHVYRNRGAAYNPRMCEEVARLSNHDCRMLHGRLKGLPRVSYALLLELLLAPTSSGLFAQHKTTGNSDNNNCSIGSSPLKSTPSMRMFFPDQYMFLRYANGCTRVFFFFFNSLILFLAAILGRESLPLEHTEQRQLQLEEGNGQQESGFEHIAFFFSNALFVESLDMTIVRLFFSFLRTGLCQRQMLVTFLRSAEFTSMHRQLLRAGRTTLTTLTMASKTHKVISSPQSSLISTRWVLGAMQLLFADVLSASIWVAFLSRGGALLYMLRDTAFTLNLHHLELLRRVLPGVVQGWIVAALSLGHNVDAARDMLAADDAEDLSDALATASGGNDFLRDAVAKLVETAAVNEDRLMPFLLHLAYSRFTAHTGAEKEAELLCTPPFSSSSSSSSPPVSPLQGQPVWQLRGTLGNYPKFPVGGGFDHQDEVFLFHWCVQLSLNTLAFFQEFLLVPSHVVNGRWVKERVPTTATATAATTVTSSGGDGVGVSGAVSSPLPGCVSPQEESVLGVLAAGGGNYVAGVAILQFVVFRLLRDVLCRVETWSTLYGISTDELSGSRSIVRQQLFFFALFVRFWSPLFVGTTKTTSKELQKMTSRNGNVDGLPALVILQWLTCTQNDTKYSHDKKEKQQMSFLNVEDLAFSFGNMSLSSLAFATNVAGTWRAEDSNNGKNIGNEEKLTEGKTLSISKNISVTTSVPGISGDGSMTNYARCADEKDFSGFSVLLLDVIRSFFDVLQETSAIEEIFSEPTQKRVEKALSAVNLGDFVGKRRPDDDDDDDAADAADDDSDSDSDSYDSDSDESLSDNSGSCEKGHDVATRHIEKPAKLSGAPVTLLHVHNLLVHYIAPML